MKKINLFDALVVVIIVGLIVLGVFLFNYKKESTGKPVLLTVKVTQNADVILPEAQKTKTVYFNSVDIPVGQVSATKEGAEAKITLRAPGTVEEEKYIFNGIRVLVGQKAEIHGIYFAQGVITEIRYE